MTFGTSAPLGLLGATPAYAAGQWSPARAFGGLSSREGYTTTANLAPGSIRHVWLIILENKSYDSEFSGVNDDTFLWQTLPSEGALLRDYHGTGHTSMDNYITLVSGQAPQYDVQSDCSDVNTEFSSNNPISPGQTGGILTGTASSVGGDSGWSYGQAVSAFGPNHPIANNASTTNGCSYPSQIATLFDQFNLAGITWKGYAQDLGGAQLIGSTSFQPNTVPGRELANECGAPGNPDEAAANPATNPTYLSGAEGYPVASNLVSSTATGGSSTTLTDTSQSWTTNQYTGDEVIITGGTGQHENATISSNTTNTLTVSAWSTVPGASSPVAPAAGSGYIIGLADTSTYTAASLVAGSGTGPDGQSYSANNPEYSDQYVAKHFPFAWFDSLTGLGAGGTGALTEPTNGGTNCDANHIANLDSPTDGLVHDLMGNTVPNFSWITPDNCSDGHDSSCKGNNLSGAFALNSDGTIDLEHPIYTPSITTGANCTPNCSGIPNYDPEATTPRNYTGGTYAADLFLAYYVPLIEHSTAFAHGLVDITFDEGEPSFVYGGNTFNNIPTAGPTGGYNEPKGGTGTTGPSGTGPEDGGPYGTPGNAPSSYPTTINPNPDESLAYGPGTANPGADSQFGADDLYADSAAESFYNPFTRRVRSVNTEPTGPNSPLAIDSNGYQLYYGPGFNLDIHRPPVCASGSDTSSGNCVAGEVLGDGGTTSSATRTDSSGVTSSGSNVTDNSIVADDTGREIVTATVGGTAVSAGTSAYDSAFQVSGGALPSGDAVYVGEVTQSGPAFPTSSGGSSLASGSFQLIDDNGNLVTPTGTVTSVTLSGECDPPVTSPTGGTNLPSTCTGNETPDPLFDALDPTTGGGDTGSVLISPYIAPGTVSNVAYNHYNWLRTMEDLFDVRSCYNTAHDITLTAGSVCGGLDGRGHLGYAAQVYLADFGSDVFTAPRGNGFPRPRFSPYISPSTALPDSRLTIALPLLGIVAMGGYLVLRRRRSMATGAS